MPRRGTTVIELIISLAVILIFCAFLVRGCTPSDSADTALVGFANTNYPGVQVLNSECQRWDTDSNGYVSCTLSLEVPGEALPVIQAVECPSAWAWNSQCRVAVGIRR